MRLLLLRTLDEGHLYSLACRQLCAALCAHGQDAAVFDFADNPGGLADRLIDGGYDAVISFSSLMGGLRLDNGVSIYDAVNTKFLGWHFDHPIYLADHILNPVAGRRTLHANRNHLRFAEAANIRGAHTVLLPGAEPHDGAVKDYADREMDVFLAATWNGMPERPWEDSEDSPAKRIVVRFVERLLAERERSVLSAFLQTCGDLGYGGLALDASLFDLLRAPLNYVRHRDRLAVVRSLADAGLRLTLCGSGWEGFLADRPNVRCLPDEAFDETRRRYGNAKVTINLNAGNGACERAVNGMLAGACVVSDYSSALSAAAGPEAICFFDRPGGRSAGEVVAELLESGRADAMATQGHAKAATTMLWSHKVEAVLALLR